MSDMPFQRPGSRPAASTESRTSPAYEPPTGPSAAHPGAARRHRGAAALVACAVTGALVGGISVGVVVSRHFAEPAPFDVTLEVFPEYILGLQREDLTARDAGATDSVLAYEAAFEEQRRSFRFSYGGDGASVVYGQKLALTIVNGRQAVPVPHKGGGGVGNAPPTLVSLETSSVSCVFQPEVGLYDSAVLNAPADLTATGRTDCVLNDAERNLSLRATSRVPGEAGQTSTEFAGILERTHAGLID